MTSSLDGNPIILCGYNVHTCKGTKTSSFDFTMRANENGSRPYLQRKHLISCSSNIPNPKLHRDPYRVCSPRTFARSPSLTWSHGLPGSPPGSPPSPRRTPVAGTTSKPATARPRRRGATGKPRRPWRSRPRSGSGRRRSGSAGNRRKRNEGRSDRGNGRNFSDLVSWWVGFFLDGGDRGWEGCN